MNTSELENVLARFPNLTLLVIGDYFLDLYLNIDHALTELSLETGLEAYQVVGLHCAPGAAGTVTSNLCALGVSVIALGVIGDDGNGYELHRALAATGVDLRWVIQSTQRVTPTYTKPILHKTDGSVHELNRLDIKNHIPLPRDLEDAILARLRDVLPRVNGVIIVDQVQESNCGVITERVRGELVRLAQEYAQSVFVAESREHISRFRNIVVQANLREAQGAVGLESVEECGAELHRRTCRPAIITAGADGIFVFEATAVTQVPGVPVTGPIDTVGAGDSVVAGFTAALCAGASVRQAAQVGNLVASVTIQQIGTTGTATPAQVLQAHQKIAPPG